MLDEVNGLKEAVATNKCAQRYTFIWNVESVMNYSETRWKINKHLLGQHLTIKLVIIDTPYFCFQGFCSEIYRFKVYGYARGCLCFQFT